MEKKEEKNISLNKESEKGLHHHVVHHVKKHKNKFLIGLFAIVILVLIVMFFSGSFDKTVKSGDTVNVDYVGTLNDGTLFDTSLQNIVINTPLYNPTRKYGPLQFTVEKGQVLGDFENAIIGMEVGETKKFTIPAERGYPVDETLIARDLPLEIVSINQYTGSIDDFKSRVGEEVELDGEYSIPGVSWKAHVDSIDEESQMLNFSAVLEVGQEIEMSLRTWNATVVAINGTEVTLLQDVKVGDVIATLDGMYGAVTKVDSNGYTVDLNLPIAGKDLNFEVTLVEIVNNNQ